LAASVASVALGTCAHGLDSSGARCRIARWRFAGARLSRRPSI